MLILCKASIIIVIYCYCKVCPTKGGRFECSTTSDKNHPSEIPFKCGWRLPCVLINRYIFKNTIFNDYFGIKNIFFKCDVSFAVQCIFVLGSLFCLCLCNFSVRFWNWSDNFISLYLISCLWLLRSDLLVL